MRFRLYGESKAKAVGLMCVCMIWLVTACSSNPGQFVNSTAQASPQSDPTPGSYQGVTIEVPRQNSTPGAHPTGMATPSQGNSNPPPGPVPQGQGSVPPAFPYYFSFGAMNPP